MFLLRFLLLYLLLYIIHNTYLRGEEFGDAGGFEAVFTEAEAHCVVFMVDYCVVANEMCLCLCVGGEFACTTIQVLEVRSTEDARCCEWHFDFCFNSGESCEGLGEAGPARILTASGPGPPS